MAPMYAHYRQRYTIHLRKPCKVRIPVAENGDLFCHIWLHGTIRGITNSPGLIWALGVWIHKLSNCTPSVISSLIKLLLSFVMFHTQQCCPTYNGIVSYAAMLPNIQWYCFIRSSAAQHTMAYTAMLPNIQWYCFIRSNAALRTMVLFVMFISSVTITK